MSYRDNKKKPSTFHINLKLHNVGAAPSTGQKTAVLDIVFGKYDGLLQPKRRFYKYINNKNTSSKIL